MRGGKAMVIAVGAPSKTTYATTTKELLQQWGEHMWTFLEVLLSQSNKIRVYLRNGQLETSLVISKGQFADPAWADATVSRSTG